MSQNKPTEEIMYDVITDLFRAVNGQPSIQKLEQLRRSGTNFAKAVDKISEQACITVFERLQSRVHAAFKAMEKDIESLQAKVDEKLEATESSNKAIKEQIEAVNKTAETVRAEIKALDKLFKGVGV